MSRIDPDNPDLEELKKQIGIMVKETQKGRSPSAIADKHDFDADFTEHIVRLYLTHPGIDADGIIRKMGY